MEKNGRDEGKRSGGQFREEGGKESSLEQWGKGGGKHKGGGREDGGKAIGKELRGGEGRGGKRMRRKTLMGG